jgi:hypothetical protein
MAGRLHGCTNERDGDAPPDPTCNPCAWVRYVPACTSVPRLVYGGGTIIGLIMQPISASDCSLTYRRSTRSVSNWIVVVNGSCDPVEQERNSYLAAPPPSDSENPNYSLLAPFPPRRSFLDVAIGCHGGKPAWPTMAAGPSSLFWPSTQW